MDSRSATSGVSGIGIGRPKPNTRPRQRRASRPSHQRDTCAAEMRLGVRPLVGWEACRGQPPLCRIVAPQGNARGALLDDVPGSANGGDMKHKAWIFPILLTVLLLPGIAQAQDWARDRLAKSPRHHEWVTVKHDQRAVETFVVYPEAKDKTPVVLVI